MDINEYFKLVLLRKCCCGCLNYEPKATRHLVDGKVENHIHCANIDKCYAIKVDLESEE